jgi:hypothetical protein
MMTRDEIMKAFDVNEQGVIQSPGKFEGEMLYVPHFWDVMMEGAGDDLHFNDGALITILPVEDGDRAQFPELAGDNEIALEETNDGFVNAMTDAAQINKIRAEYEKESAAIEPEEPVVATQVITAKAPEEPAPEFFQVGDKVEFPVQWLGQEGFGQGEIASIENDIAMINVDSDPKTPEWAPLNELRKITEYTAVMDPADTVKTQREDEVMVTESSTASSEEARKMVIQAMGYKDLPAQLRACFLLGLAEQKIWKSAVDQIKKKHEKEMKEKVKALTKWGTIQPSPAAVKDIIAKVLIANGISAYPNLIEALYANPFQNRGAVVPENPNETMSEPR